MDLPLLGARHRDTRNGLERRGAKAGLIRAGQLLRRPAWAWNVGVRGKPHSCACLADQAPGGRDLDAFRQWVDAQFDASVAWRDIDWLRGLWNGRLILKGALDVEDAREAARVGANGVIVSNHGGRQLDSACSSISKLPSIAQAVGADLEVLMDGGVRSGADIFKALALGARGVLIGRPWAWALAGDGERGVRDLLKTLRDELHNVMALAGVTRVGEIGESHLDAIRA